MTEIYCLKCKNATGSKNESIYLTKNKRKCLKGICIICGSSKNKFVSKNYSEGGSIMNKVIEYIPEIHMKDSNGKGENVPNGKFNNSGKYSYCGPGTKFVERMKEGYKGINNLDKACLVHDYSYQNYPDHKDTWDLWLTKKSSEIANDPNIDEQTRNDAKLVTFLMSTKNYFGLGVCDRINKLNNKIIKGKGLTIKEKKLINPT